MTAPVLNSAGGSTPNRLWVPEVDLNGNPAAPNWQPIQYVNQFDFNPDNASMQDATVFADGGFSGQDKLGAAWSATVTVQRMVVPNTSPPVYDPAQEYLRIKSIGQFGPANFVYVRIYDFDVNDVAGTITPRAEAYYGKASVSWPGTASGGQDQSRTVAIALTGKGKLSIIAHPYPATPVIANVDTVAPTAVSTAGGQLVTIRGRGFSAVTGAAGVKIGGTNATSYTVLSDNVIAAITPAHAAGSAQVLVTNGVGASTNAVAVTYA